METYPIHAVEQLTGVKAHTLRIWEKRYQSLIPHRTSTNIRYYDGEQLRKLLNISTLQQRGFKISALMGMSDAELHAQLLQLTDDKAASGINDVFVNELVAHMLAFDEPAFDKTCNNVIIRFGMQDAILNVIFPFLKKTGVLWSTKNAAPSQEHFASNIVKRKLLTAIDGAPPPTGSKNKFILFLPPDEWHEIGLLLADYVLRLAGQSCIYLGQSLPFESLETALEQTRATHLLTSFTTGLDKSDHIRKLSGLADKYHKPAILIGTSDGDSLFPNITLLKSPLEILKHL